MLVVQLRTAQPELDPRVVRFNSLFSEEGWDTSIVYWRRGGKATQTTAISANAVLNSSGTLAYPPFWVMPLLLVLYYIRSLTLLVKLHPHVCIAHQLDTLPVALFARLLVSDMKVVFDNEDVYSLMVARAVPDLIQHMAHEVESTLATHADMSIFPCDAMREYVLRGSVRSLVVPNVPEESFVGLNRDEAKKFLRVGSNFVIGHFGYLVADRGIETLVTAIGKLSRQGENVTCLMTSGGPLLNELKDLAISTGAARNVRFLGRVERSEIPCLLSACEASAILHTKRDPMNWLVNPNKLFESMLIGVPIIATNFGEIARIVKEADCGLLVDPESVEAVASAIKALKTDSKLRERFSLNGIEAMRTKFSRETVERSLVDAITQLDIDR